MLIWRVHSVGYVMCQGKKSEGGRAWWRWEHAICAALAISHLTDAQHIYPAPSLFYFPPSLKLAPIHLQPAPQSISHALLLFWTSVCEQFPYILFPLNAELSSLIDSTVTYVSWQFTKINRLWKSLLNLQWIERKWKQGEDGKRMSFVPNQCPTITNKHLPFLQFICRHIPTCLKLHNL